jgi:hypothetical protein
MGLATIFYSLRSETSPFVASYDSQGYDGGIRPSLHTASYIGQRIFMELLCRLPVSMEIVCRHETMLTETLVTKQQKSCS